MKVEDQFIMHINDNYSYVENKLRILCGRNKQKFDEDIYHEALLRCYNAIQKKGKMNDTTPYGMQSYLIRSYFNLVKEEARSCRVRKRDLNYDNVNDIYEQWYNSNNTSSQEKIQSDLYKDFTTLYIMLLVEQNFDQEHYYLFKLKHLCNMTYKQVCAHSKGKGCRQKILEVKDWLKENLKKEDVNKIFFEMYGELC